MSTELHMTASTTSRRTAVLCLLVLPVLLAAGCVHKPPEPSRDPSLAIPGIWPVDHPTHPVTSPYGSRSDPRRFRTKTRFHSGIDIGVPKGTPVIAAGDGTVEFARRGHDHLGRKVVIDHGNGYRTTYAHLANVRTRRGKRVLQGDVIGAVGKSGRATGPHLHYEVHSHSARRNPMEFLPR